MENAFSSPVIARRRALYHNLHDWDERTLASGLNFTLATDLGDLEGAKRAAGRAKDLLDLAEIAEIRRRSSR